MSEDRASSERDLDDLSLLLGGIKNQLHTITTTLSENRTADAQYRTDVRGEMRNIDVKIEKIDDRITIELKSIDQSLNKIQLDQINTKHELDLLKPVVARMNTVVTSLEQRMHMSKGVANAAMILGKLAHLFSAVFGGVLALVANKWLGGH